MKIENDKTSKDRKYKTFRLCEVVDGENEVQYFDGDYVVINDELITDYLHKMESKIKRLNIFILLNIILTAFLISKMF